MSGQGREIILAAIKSVQSIMLASTLSSIDNTQAALLPRTFLGTYVRLGRLDSTGELKKKK